MAVALRNQIAPVERTPPRLGKQCHFGEPKAEMANWMQPFVRRTGYRLHPIGCGHGSAPAAKICALKIFFIIFVDRIFTTFIRLPFTNTSDAMAPMRALSCV
jgi:hypothetical protein